MSPETRTFLALVRDAEDPTPGDESRVLAAVSGAVALGAAGASVAGGAKASNWLAYWGAAWKLGLAVLGLGAGVGLARSPAAFGRPDVATGFRALPALEAPATVVVGPLLRASELPSAEPVLGKATSLREEIALLADVRALLARGDGAGALRRLDERVTADRQLEAERSAARVLALCALGRDDEARPLAEAFLRDHPQSVQRAAVARSCGGEKVDLAR